MGGTVHTLRVPKLIDLHSDPFERGPEEGIDYNHWRIDRVFLLVPAQASSGNGCSPSLSSRRGRSRLRYTLDKETMKKLAADAANARTNADDFQREDHERFG